MKEIILLIFQFVSSFCRFFIYFFVAAPKLHGNGCVLPPDRYLYTVGDGWGLASILVGFFFPFFFSFVAVSQHFVNLRRKSLIFAAVGIADGRGVDRLRACLYTQIEGGGGGGGGEAPEEINGSFISCVSCVVKGYARSSDEMKRSLRSGIIINKDPPLYFFSHVVLPPP